MRTTHELTISRALIISGALVLVAGLLFALMPMRQVAAKQPASAQPKQTTLKPTTSRMNFAAYTKMQAALKNQTAAAASPFDFRTATPITHADFMANAKWAVALFNADETITLSSTPVSGSTVAPGELVLYTTTVTNPTRPGVLQDINASVSVRIPAGVTYQGLTLGGTGGFLYAACTQPAIGAAGPQTVTCPNAAGMLAGTTMTFGVLAQVTAAPGAVIATPAASTYTDQDGIFGAPATISSAQPATFNVGIANLPADLAVNKIQVTNGTLAPGQVIAGGTLSGVPATVGTGEIRYQINVANTGPNDASNVTIRDNVPANVLYVPGSLVLPAGFTCTSLPSGGTIPIPGEQFRCEPADSATPGRLNAAVNSFSSIFYKVSVPASVAQGTIIQNAALIFSSVGPGGSNPDPNAANNLSLTVPTQVLASADVQVTKTVDNPTPINGGAAFAYTVTVTNPGPSDAQNVVMNDALPAGILFQNVTVVNSGGAQFNCTGPMNNTNGTISCTSGVLPVGGMGVISIVVQAAGDLAGGVRRNQAIVSSSTTDPTPANNATPTTALNPAEVMLVNNANLTITKQGLATACAGDLFTYLIVVSNTGNSNALLTQLLDNLPANTTFVSLKETGDLVGKCAYNPNLHAVGCGNFGPSTPASLARGFHNLDITIRLNPNAPVGTLSNTAQLSFAGPVPPPAFPILSNTVNTTVSHCIDLEVTKSDSPDAVLPGGIINYTVAVKNIGPSDIVAANEVRITDTFDINDFAHLTSQINIAAPQFTCNAAAVTQTFNCDNTQPIPAGSTAFITFSVKTNADFVTATTMPTGGVVDNSVTGGIFPGVLNVTEANLGNNTSATHTPVGPNADLQLTKTSSPAAVIAGDPAGIITYTINYRNNGPGDAVNVVISDTVQANLLAVGAINVAGAPNFTCVPAAPTPGQQFRCTPTFPGPVPVGVLPSGAAGTITYQVRVPANVPAGSLIANAALITSEGPNATPDPNTSNNSQNSTSTLVNTSADLSLIKTGTANAAAGTNVVYTLTATNNGPSDAQSVVITDVLNSNLEFISATSTNANVVCSPASQGGQTTVVCTLATLPAAAGSNVAVITITAKVKANTPNGTPINNSATVASTTADPVANNNNSNLGVPVLTTVTTEAAVTIVKTDSPDPVVAGTNLLYTITVANAGPSDAVTANVVDTLPAGVTFVAASGGGIFSAANACTFAAPNVTCTPTGGVIPAGSSSNINIVVSVPPNTVQAASPLNGQPNTDQTEPCAVVAGTLCNSVTANWQDSNGVVGALVANTDLDVERTNVRHESDMLIKKEAPDFVNAGSRMDYRLIVSNLGPSTVLGDATQGSVMVRDLLPLGVTLADLNGAAAGLGNNPVVSPGGPGNFTCYLNPVLIGGRQEVVCLNQEGAGGDFPAVGSIEIIVKVDTASNLPNGSNLVNCATVTLRDTNPTPELDPLGGGQHNDGVTGVRPNQPTTFPTITTAASGSNESCDSTVVQTSADLAISKSALPVVDPDGAGGPLLPVALPIVGPNVPPGSVNAGGYIRYDIPFGNNGPSDAINTIITDQIAGNTAFVGALATGGVFVPAAQPPGIPFVFTIQAVDTVAPLGGPISLTCTVWQAAGTQSIYCRPQGNAAVANPTPPPATIAYADGTLPAGYNGTLTFFVGVNESVSGGTIVANPANITSGLCPNGVGPAPPIFPPVACLGTADPDTANNTSLATQTLAIASSNLTISKIVQSAVTSASNPSQTGPVGPATPPNGVAVTGTAVLPGTTLTYRITITNTGPSDVSNIRITDVLPSGLETPPGRVLGARFVSATPVLPSGATFTCAPPSGIDPTNNPQGNGGSVVCTAPLLSANAPNNTAAVDIKVFIDAATKGNLVDVATFDATINNFNRPVSGSTTLTTPVAATSDLALTKTHVNAAGVLNGPVTAGTDFEYQVTITNNGPSAAQMVNLVDTIPAFQSLLLRNQLGTLVPDITIVTTPDGNGASNFSCTPAADATTDPRGSTSTITCTAAELPPNKKADGTVNPAGTVLFRIRMRQSSLTPQPPPATQNCVTATSMSTDPVPANNTNICDPVTIIFNSPLAGVKTDTPDPVIAGNLLTYTITASPEGPSAALNFTIEDPLPVGTVFISAVASPGAVLTTPAVNANGTVRAIWNALGGTDSTPGIGGNDGLTPVGTPRTLTIVVRVCPDFQQIRSFTDAQMCVPNLLNEARIYSDTPPNLITAPRIAPQTTTVQAQSDLAIMKTGPANIIPSSMLNDSIATYTLMVTNAGPSNANNTIVRDTLPKGWTFVSATVVPKTGDPGAIGNAFSTATVNGITTVTVDLGVMGAANQCNAVPRALGATITIRARVPNKHPNQTVTNTATVSTSNCAPDPNLANNTATFNTIVGPPANEPGPGTVDGYPAASEVSDQKAGSILFFPIYSSDPSSPNRENTRFNITNTSSTEKACLHLYMVDGASCGVLDAFLCLTPNQTASLLASDLDPGQTGYMMVVSVDCNTGLPMAFNCLIGDAFVKFGTGHQANLGAEAIAANMMFPGGVDTTATSVTLQFNGMHYNRLPRILALDSVGSRADGNDTLLVVDAVAGNFITSGGSIVSLFGSLYDDAEQAFSFTQTAPNCQYRNIISNNFPRLLTRFETLVPSGRTGWMKFWSSRDVGLFGVAINRNGNANSSSGAFNQGHNLHKLTLTDASTVIVPVGVPSCNQ